MKWTFSQIPLWLLPRLIDKQSKVIKYIFYICLPSRLILELGLTPASDWNLWMAVVPIVSGLVSRDVNMSEDCNSSMFRNTKKATLCRIVRYMDLI